MYQYLRGHLREFHPGQIILEVNGVGFDLAIPTSAVEITASNAELLVWTHLHFKDDGFQLYGFLSRTERDLFRLLLKVSGIGPKMAMQIISGIQPQELVSVMAAEDWKRLTLIPGIGPKTARRLLIELKERLTHQELQFISTSGAPVEPVLTQAFAALTNLGFAPEAVRVALKDLSPAQIGDLSEITLEEIIKKGLARLAP